MNRFLRKFYILIINKIPTSNSSRGLINNIKTRVLKNIFRKIGNNVNVMNDIDFSFGSNISIGDNSGIGKGCSLNDSCSINIGKNVLIGPEVIFYTTNHKIDRNKLIVNQGFKFGEININDDVWIGARAIILPGVTIAKGAVVGAGAVVTKNIGEYEIVGGVPAKKIGERV